MDCIIIDDLPPEVIAMLQALYSRSPKSVREHLKQVLERGPEKFMSTYYVGYNHKSIGDCGSTSIFAEHVSMLAAKAVQDNPLYSGQEASTRYLDMANQPIINPLGTLEGEVIQNKWIDLYKEILSTLIPLFEERFPREDGQKKSVWKKAVKARAFDVARGFLPAGCTTFVAWHTNLRQAADHLKSLRHNPCKEIRDLGNKIHEELIKKYPSSFGHQTSEDQEKYLSDSADNFAYYNGKIPKNGFYHFAMMDYGGLREHYDLLRTRPPKTELHQRWRQYGMIRFEFPLDFGSYRDLQRQRSCVQEMPLLTTKHGILPWYLEQLPKDLRHKVEATCWQQKKAIAELNLIDEERQYYVAMGYIVSVRITCPLPSAVYIAELRSGTTVHPTLRVIAQKMGDTLELLIPGLAMYHDKSAGVWDIKRGKQDIIKINDKS